MERRHRLVLVSGITGLVLAGGAARAMYNGAEQRPIIHACVDARTGAPRIVGDADVCKKTESSLEWNFRGPEGPMGPRGPRGEPGPAGPRGAKGDPGAQGQSGASGSSNGGSAPGALRVVDANGADVGSFLYPNVVALTIGSETVLTSLDLPSRVFDQSATPTLYFTAAGCAGTPLMYLDLLRYGTVSSGTLSYPTGNVVATGYGSYLQDGACTTAPGAANLSARGTTSIASFVGPFTLSR